MRLSELEMNYGERLVLGAAFLLILGSGLILADKLGLGKSAVAAQNTNSSTQQAPTRENAIVVAKAIKGVVAPGEATRMTRRNSIVGE